MHLLYPMIFQEAFHHPTLSIQQIYYIFIIKLRRLTIKTSDLCRPAGTLQNSPSTSKLNLMGDAIQGMTSLLGFPLNTGLRHTLSVLPTQVLIRRYRILSCIMHSHVFVHIKPMAHNR